MMESVDKMIRDQKKRENEIVQKYIDDTASKWEKFVNQSEKLWAALKPNLNIPGKGMDFFSRQVMLLFDNFRTATTKARKEYEKSMEGLYR